VLSNELKTKIKLIDIIHGNKRYIGNKVIVNPCPICGKKDHFYIYLDTNTYYSFSGCCRGGSPIDYYIETKAMTAKQAMIELATLADINLKPYANRNGLYSITKVEPEPYFDWISDTIQKFEFLLSELQDMLRSCTEVDEKLLSLCLTIERVKSWLRILTSGSKKDVINLYKHLLKLEVI
jgi:hypothetical protein